MSGRLFMMMKELCYSQARPGMNKLLVGIAGIFLLAACAEEPAQTTQPAGDIQAGQAMPQSTFTLMKKTMRMGVKTACRRTKRRRTWESDHFHSLRQ